MRFFYVKLYVAIKLENSSKRISGIYKVNNKIFAGGIKFQE